MIFLKLLLGLPAPSRQLQKRYHGNRTTMSEPKIVQKNAIVQNSLHFWVILGVQ
jgi:hypothetical protein